MSYDTYELSKIARLYYEDSRTLRQIAEKLHVSTATVSRYIAEAKARGIVQITIRDPMADFREVEAMIESAYGLKECRVVPTYDHAPNVYRDMARALGELFARLLRPRMLVGLSWGQTLKEVGEALSPQTTKSCDTIPILGAIGTVETGIYPNAISRTYAERLGGQSYLVNAPAVLDSGPIRDSIERESTFLPAKRLWERLDVALLSVSGLDDGASVSRFKVLDRSTLGALRTAGIACATNFIMLDEQGREIDTELATRMLRLSLRELRRVEHRIILAAGLTKRVAIVSALRGGLATALITDHATAEAIVSNTQ